MRAELPVDVVGVVDVVNVAGAVCVEALERNNQSYRRRTGSCTSNMKGVGRHKYH